MDDEWEHAKEKIDAMIVKKAEEEGVTKKLFFEFQEFDLAYMQEENGGLCYRCTHGMECPRHGLTK